MLDFFVNSAIADIGNCTKTHSWYVKAGYTNRTYRRLILEQKEFQIKTNREKTPTLTYYQYSANYPPAQQEPEYSDGALIGNGYSNQAPSRKHYPVPPEFQGREAKNAHEQHNFDQDYATMAEVIKAYNEEIVDEKMWEAAEMLAKNTQDRINKLINLVASST
ncbi:MAG: hypothetical protein ACH34X_09460 [Thiolinea sp.]